MTDRPLVSIITPNYNKAPYLEESLLSVLEQDYPHLEYILIDGGSTDGSLDIIRKYQGRIDRWLSEPDQGQSHAINKGFALARGQVVAWLNSDDLYFPGAVSRAMARFAADPELDFLYGQGVLLTATGEFLGYLPQIEPFNRHRLLSCYNYLMQPACFFKKQTLDRLGYLDTSLNYVMDWELWCRFAAAGCKFRYEPELLAADRQYEGTKTRSGGWARLLEIRELSQNFRRGPWPHGYFAYAASHMRAERRRAGSLWQKAMYAGAEGLYNALNSRNLYFQWHRPRWLHGIYYGAWGRGLSQASDRLLAPQVQVKQPLYRRAEKLTLGLRRWDKLRDSAVIKGTVSLVNGPQASVELSPTRPAAELTLQLPPQVQDSHLLQVDFSFTGLNGKSQAAAWLSSFQIS